MTATTASTSTATSISTRTGCPLAGRAATAAWAALLLLAAVPAFGALTDLAADLRGRIPADHTPALGGATLAAARHTQPGVARYLHTLELGYAGHELLFAGLLIAIVAIPLRRRAPWAWVSCWALTAADTAYAVGFGAYDPTVLRRATIAAACTTIALLVYAPAVFRHRRPTGG